MLVRVADVLGRLSDQPECPCGLEPSLVCHYLDASCMMLVLSTQLVPEADLQPAEEQHLCSCARLVLSSGTRAALQGISQLWQGVPCDPQWKRLLLTGQLALDYCMRLAMSADCLSWFVANAATPAPLARCLAATVAGLELLSQQPAQPSEISCVPACIREHAPSLPLTHI